MSSAPVAAEVATARGRDEGPGPAGGLEEPVLRKPAEEQAAVETLTGSPGRGGRRPGAILKLTAEKMVGLELVAVVERAVMPELRSIATIDGLSVRSLDHGVWDARNREAETAKRGRTKNKELEELARRSSRAKKSPVAEPKSRKRAVAGAPGKAEGPRTPAPPSSPAGGRKGVAGPGSAGPTQAPDAPVLGGGGGAGFARMLPVRQPLLLELRGSAAAVQRAVRLLRARAACRSSCSTCRVTGP